MEHIMSHWVCRVSPMDWCVYGMPGTFTAGDTTIYSLYAKGVMVFSLFTVVRV
jgi:hypothetical protein